MAFFAKTRSEIEQAINFVKDVPYDRRPFILIRDAQGPSTHMGIKLLRIQQNADNHPQAIEVDQINLGWGIPYRQFELDAIGELIVFDN